MIYKMSQTDFEANYKSDKKLNHIIPKCYYKPWSCSCGNDKKSFKLHVIDKEGTLCYKSIEKFNRSKYAFVIRFGDTFLPESVKQKFIDITKKYKFLYRNKEYNNLDYLSHYYLYKDWIVKDRKTGADAKRSFETEISAKSCYSIEVGLDKVFESWWNVFLSKISDLFSDKTDIDVQEIIDYIIRVYPCFYLRSDGWKDIFKVCYNELDNKCCENISEKKGINDEKMRDKIYDGIRKQFLYELLYEQEISGTIYDIYFKGLQNKNILIYKNCTNILFDTSKNPIVNIEGNMFFIISPRYLVSFIDAHADERKINKEKIIESSKVERVNRCILEKVGKVVTLNKLPQ